MTSKTTAEQIKRGMALAFFATAFADMREEQGDPMTGEIMDQLPADIDPAALKAADTLTAGLIDSFTFKEPGLNETQKLAVIYMYASNLLAEDPCDADRELTPDSFGHYCAMQAMGQGVGLESFGDRVCNGFSVPYVEFGHLHLEGGYTE